MTLTTILLIIINGTAVEVEYPSSTACGDALLVLATSDLNHDGQLYARCIPTRAPTVSLLPMVRP